MDNKWFYYVRDIENRPVITVCLIEKLGEYYRGVALCSELDQPCKRVGRNIAEGRAISALKNIKNTLPLKRIGTPFIFRYKSCILYENQLTDFEKKLIKRK